MVENSFKGVEVGRILFIFVVLDKLFCVRLVMNIIEFVLDEKKGILIIRRILDWEVNSFYLLNVVLLDGSVEMNIILNIMVGDVNDNLFVFVGMVESYNIILLNVVFIG